MGGIATEFLSTNVFSAVGTLSLTALDTNLENILQHGSQNKVIFAAPTPSGALSRLMGADWVFADETTDIYGVKVNTFIDGAFGARLPVITMRDWGNEAATGKGRGGWIVVLDLAYLKKRPLRDRNTRLLRNRQGNGVDSVIHEYLTEMSLEVAQEKCHGLFQGVTG